MRKYTLEEMTAALRFGINVPPGMLEQAADALDAAARVIEPFANTVYNDNGDVTVTKDRLEIHDYFAAYQWQKRMTWLYGSRKND